MKHFYIFVLALALGEFSAQSGVNNLSFENWTGGLPDGWEAISGVTQKTSGAQHGNSYCELKTSAVMPAMLKVGGFDDNGVPYSNKVAQLSGFYRVSGMSVNEFAGIAVGLTKDGESIGGGALFAVENKANWTSFTAVVYTTQPGPPDSISIIITSPAGSGTWTPGATLDVDNLSLSATVDIDERSLGTSFMVYPNPAANQVNILTPGGHFSFELITTDGKKVKQVYSAEELLKVDLCGLSPGIYFYNLTGEDSVAASGKLAIQ